MNTLISRAQKSQIGCEVHQKQRDLGRIKEDYSSRPAQEETVNNSLVHQSRMKAQETHTPKPLKEKDSATGRPGKDTARNQKSILRRIGGH